MQITLEPCEVMEQAENLDVYHVMIADSEGSEPKMIGHVSRPRDGGSEWELRFKSAPAVLVHLNADTVDELKEELRKHIGVLPPDSREDRLQNSTMDSMVQQVLSPMFDLAQATDTVTAFCSALSQTLAHVIATQFEPDQTGDIVQRTADLIGLAVKQEIRQAAIRDEMESIFKTAMKAMVSKRRDGDDGEAPNDEIKH